MAANTPVTNINPEAQQNIIALWRQCHNALASTWNIREQLLNIDRAYMREQDWTQENQRARLANTYGDSTKFQNVTVPVVMPQVETAVVYQASVFLSGSPLFPVSASPAYADAARQMETLIDDQAIKGAWINQLELALRDGFKYNLFGCEIAWTEKKIWALKTDGQFSTKEAKPTQILWAGNTLKRLDPYNMIMDIRYPPSQIAEKGEFAGYSELMSRTQLISYLESLKFKYNYKRALESGPASVSSSYPTEFFLPWLNPQAFINQNQFAVIDWSAWAGLTSPTRNSIQYKNSYYVSTFYCRIIPADLRIGDANSKQVQIWKFVIVNGCELIYAERQTNAHDYLPILFGQPLEDGLGYQTKSFAQNVIPYQQIASALMNSSMAAKRRAISDRGLYDPSRVDARHINSDVPNAKIPVRPSAYGKPLSEAYMPIGFRDDQSQFAMADMAQAIRFAEQAAGQNPAQQGQFVKGNKTLHEYENVMSNASGRQQLTALKLQGQFFTPLKEIIKSNILQYQTATEVFSVATEEIVNVDPITLRNATLQFKLSDGLLPASKQMNSDAFASATQFIMGMPQIAQGYNVAPMVSYLFKTQRADVAPFEKSQEQIAYEQALSQWQNAVAGLAQAYSSLKKPDGSGYTPEEINASLPPQPTPEQFSYNPSQPQVKSSAPNGTVMQQYQTATAQAAQASASQSTNQGNNNGTAPAI